MFIFEFDIEVDVFVLDGNGRCQGLVGVQFPLPFKGVCDPAKVLDAPLTAVNGERMAELQYALSPAR
jgi:hypothetical protein